MAASIDEWVGCAYLFLQATSEEGSLPTLYSHPHLRPRIYKALKVALADSGGFRADILKIQCSDDDLIVQLKFCKQENCRKFLRSYKKGEFQGAFQSNFNSYFPFPGLELLLKTELRAGADKLDSIMQEEERCLESISREKPDHLLDEALADLEAGFMGLSLGRSAPPSWKRLASEEVSLPTLNSSPPSIGPREISKPSVEEDNFFFQNQPFANRKITPDDHQTFAKLVSKKWKQVGRSLYLQTKCRALKDPCIDNLAIEYERDGLYEQAYQLLRRFIDSEGKKATIQCLVAALEDNGLINIAEELLGLYQSDL